MKKIHGGFNYSTLSYFVYHMQLFKKKNAFFLFHADINLASTTKDS